MIVDIGDIIIDKINTLPFLDKYAGVVKVITKQAAEGGKIIKFPAYARASFEECQQGGRYMDLCPDNSKKSLLYLEDKGIRVVKTDGIHVDMSASLDLVCWLNQNKFTSVFHPTTEYVSYSAPAIAGIMRKLMGGVKFNKINAFSNINYHLIYIQVVGQKSKAENPFAKYSYDENINQFLLYPFDYFVLELRVDFRLDMRCISVDQIFEDSSCAKNA